MQRVFTALLLLLMTSPAWAQSSVPGTFNRPQPRRESDLYSTPLITTPQVTWSGWSGPVLVTGQTAVLSSPQVEYQPATTALEESEEPSLGEVAAASRQRGVQVAKKFDYVIAPGEGFSMGEAGEQSSLGEMAASLRKGPPPTQRSFTNDDITRMNSSSSGNYAMPAGKAPDAQPQAAPAPQKNQTEKPHSPFAPQMSAED